MQSVRSEPRAVWLHSLLTSKIICLLSNPCASLWDALQCQLLQKFLCTLYMEAYSWWTEAAYFIISIP